MKKSVIIVLLRSVIVVAVSFVTLTSLPLSVNTTIKEAAVTAVTSFCCC